MITMTRQDAPAGVASADPRPDLHEDHHLWEDALRAALDRAPAERDLYWTLDGLRCLGVRLRSTTSGALRLEPGEMDEGEFREDCARYLLPHLPLLREVLRTTAGREV